MEMTNEKGGLGMVRVVLEVGSIEKYSGVLNREKFDNRQAANSGKHEPVNPAFLMRDNELGGKGRSFNEIYLST